MDIMGFFNWKRTTISSSEANAPKFHYLKKKKIMSQKKKQTQDTSQ